MKLQKETINNIKYFLKNEADSHKYGDWDRMRITWIKIYTDGRYSFRIYWLHTVGGRHDDMMKIEGDLNDYPIRCVLDCLDVAQMIFYPIHKRAYERQIEYTNDAIKKLEENNNYLYQIYENER